MVSDRDSKSDKARPFVEVETIDGKKRRFAAGTKAGFALERLNNSRIQETTEGGTRSYSHIESVKEGEGAVEFGPDAELVSYGEGWQLRAVQESNFTCARSLQTGASKPHTKDEMKAINRAQTKGLQLVWQWHLPPADLPQYKPPSYAQKDSPPEVANAPLATVCGKGNEVPALKLEKRDSMVGQIKNIENWQYNISSKWHWPVETEDEISYKQKRERSFIMANPDKRHDMLTRIYCPSLSPAKHQFYSINKI